MAELSPEEVARLAEAIAARMAQAVPAPKPCATIAEIFKAYENHRRNDHSWIVIRDRLRPLVRLLGDLPADQLTPKKWAQHRAVRLQEVARKDQPPSGATLNLELSRAKTMLSWAVEDEQGFLTINPLREAKRQKQKPPRRTWLAEGDLQRVLASRCPVTPRARVMFRAHVLLQADTGLRFNEARTLRRDRVVEVDDGGYLAHIPDTKNGRAHSVGLTPRIWSALSDIPVCLGSPFFFANPDNRGRLFSESSMWRWFRDAAEAAGVDALVADGEIRVRPHDLRRSAATNAHNRGATLLEVQDMLNHSNPGITSQYVQRTQANAVRIAQLMADGAAKEQRRGPLRAQPTAHSSLEKKNNPG